MSQKNICHSKFFSIFNDATNLLEKNWSFFFFLIGSSVLVEKKWEQKEKRKMCSKGSNLGHPDKDCNYVTFLFGGDWKFVILQRGTMQEFLRTTVVDQGLCPSN